MLDMVLLALMEVDCLRMNCGQRRGEIDFADYFRLAPVFSGRIDDDEVVGRDRTQTDRVRWIGFVDPVPVSAALMQESGFSKLLAKSRQIDVTEPLIWRNG